MRRSIKINSSGFTMAELLAVIALLLTFVGLFLDGGAVTGNTTRAAENSQEILEVERYPNTTITSAWSFRCGTPTAAADTITSINPRFRSGDSVTNNDPGNVTALSVADTDARYVAHGNGCIAMFNDPDINRVLCSSPFNSHICVSVSTRAQTTLFGTSDITQSRFKSESSDTRCLQASTAGSVPAVLVPGP